MENSVGKVEPVANNVRQGVCRRTVWVRDEPMKDSVVEWSVLEDSVDERTSR